MNIKPIGLAATLIMVSFSFLCRAQSVIIQSQINLPQDTTIKNQLISSLNGFLGQKGKPNRENTYVLKDYLPETSDLLDEMKGVEKNAKFKDPDFYKCYLTNVAKIDENSFMVQIAYIGIQDSMPVLRASFRLLAKREGSQFYFNSPLKQNTVTWKIKKFNDLTCYFKDTLNTSDVKAYQQKVAFYNKKLKSPDFPIEFYYCDNFNEVQQILGIDYKLDYNGSRSNDLTSHENDKILIVNGQTQYPHRFDAHDLWHERLRTVMTSTMINRPVDEGCAYLYGGSWGYTWDEVLTRFKNYLAANPNADWLTLYTESAYFEKGEKPMIVAYVLNALIAQKIENEKGFTPVMDLLGCGPREKGDENYFKALEKVAGIKKADFNSTMWELIKSAK